MRRRRSRAGESQGRSRNAANAFFFAGKLSRTARASASGKDAAATLSSRRRLAETDEPNDHDLRRSWMAILTNRAADTRDRGVDTALLILRVVLGILVLLHGISKLPPPPKE